MSNAQALADLSKYTKADLIELVSVLLTQELEKEVESEVEVSVAPPVAVVTDTPTLIAFPDENSLWSALDEDYCQVFWPIVKKYAQFINSEDRVEQRMAATSDIFKQRFMVKPEEGFLNADHETAFLRSWNSNMTLLPMQLAGAGGSIGFILGAVYNKFETESWLFKYLPALASKRKLGKGTAGPEDARQPWNNNGKVDEIRKLFEDYYSSDKPWERQRMYAAGVVRNLDSEFALLNKEAKLSFLVANPGYEPPEKEGTALDHTLYWSAGHRAAVERIMNDPARLARIKAKNPS